MRSKLSFLFFSVFVTIFISSPVFAEFWGSKNSNKYHYTTCKWAQRIKPANLVRFETPEAAITAGYVPCKICKPPVKSKAEVDGEDCFNLAGIGYSYDENDPTRRGCCSWHGGVCGCENGRVVCCDGTYSPSCRCTH